MARPREPIVSAEGVEFALPAGRLRGVALAHDLRPPREVPFGRRGGRFELAFPRPPVDRMEYLLRLEHRDGSFELVPDPTNPRHAPGAFGAKSVVEFPEYAPPGWVGDDGAATGTVMPLELRLRGFRGRIRALAWTPADYDVEEPLPLLVVHDGAQYAEYSALLRLLDHLVDFGEVPPLRALLLPPPGDRNESYSASTRYARALADDALAAVPRDERRRPVLLGASLGAVAALHAHWTRPGTYGALFLQSGSFFRRRHEAYESAFGRFGRLTRFVEAASRGDAERVPATLTCGAGEENFAGNRSLAEALERAGWELRAVWHPDAHNWISWRDSLHPHLAELLSRAWT